VKPLSPLFPFLRLRGIERKESSEAEEEMAQVSAFTFTQEDRSERVHRLGRERSPGAFFVTPSRGDEVGV